MREIDEEYEKLRSEVDEELKKILDEEDKKRKGVIGETYQKLSEILNEKGRADDCIKESIVYTEELDIMAGQWNDKTKEDCGHLDERLEKLRACL